MRSAPKRELRTDEEARSCDVCGRTILKGERTEPYLAPGGRRRTVCELCVPRADHEGWIRESASAMLPATRSRPAQRRSFRDRLRGMFDGDERPPRREREAEPDSWAEAGPEPAPERDAGSAGAGADEADAAMCAAEPGSERERSRERMPEREQRPRREPPREARHIRAVPTTAQVKVERALEVFNVSEHPRTIAGIARTLGTPWVHASPDGGAPSEVTIVVAWELSWYRYRVDLGDEHEPILLLEKGDELGELEEALREWNATVDQDGRLSAAVG